MSSPGNPASYSRLAGPLEPSAAEPDRQLVNCLAGAGAFFVNIRVPAALTAGASLGSLFLFFKPGVQHPGLVETAYTTIDCTSVAFELATIFVATATGVKLTSGAVIDPMAVDVMAFLVREVEFSYLFVRIHFFTGLELLLVSMAIRSLMLLSPSSLGISVATFLLGMVASMLAIFQTTTAPFYTGIFHMIRRFLVLAVTDIGRQQPFLGCIVAISMIAAFSFAIKALLEIGGIL